MADETRKTSKSGISATKAGGYAAQKKYRATHPNSKYEPKVRIDKNFKPVLQALLDETGLSITDLFVNAVEEKYDIKLH